MPFVLQTSIHGRRLGLSTTGGLIIGTSRGSTVFDNIAAVRDSTGTRISPLNEPLATYSSSEATLSSSGVSVLSSATSTAYTFTVPTPAAGVGIEIISQSSATTITLQTSATTILFFDSSLLGTGATGLVITTASTDGGNYGAAVVLRGLSATRWQVLHKPKSSTAAV